MQFNFEDFSSPESSRETGPTEKLSTSSIALPAEFILGLVPFLRYVPSKGRSTSAMRLFACSGKNPQRHKIGQLGQLVLIEDAAGVCVGLADAVRAMIWNPALFFMGTSSVFEWPCCVC